MVKKRHVNCKWANGKQKSLVVGIAKPTVDFALSSTINLRTNQLKISELKEEIENIINNWHMDSKVLTTNELIVSFGFPSKYKNPRVVKGMKLFLEVSFRVRSDYTVFKSLCESNPVVIECKRLTSLIKEESDKDYYRDV